jgi:hypothetical protein
MNASFRKYWYLATGLIAALIPIAIQFGLLDAGQANNTSTLITTIGSMLGAGGALTASAVTHKQQQEGMPESGPTNPLEIITRNAPVVLQQAAEAQANVDKMREVTADLVTGLTNTLNATPIVGGMVAPTTDLAQQAINSILRP